MKGVSIVVCCYNSAQRIGETIKHLTLLSHPDCALEVIIVNNASKDNTVEVATEAWESWYQESFGQKTFKIVNEQIPGLTAARRRGVSEAVYEYLIFVDDDNWLNPDYVIEVQKLFVQHSNAAVLGGKGIPYFENEVEPEWFKENIGWYAVGEQGEADGKVSPARSFVYGAGACWRVDVLKEIFKKHLLLTDRLGNNLSSGGDIELCYNAILMGYDIHYSSKLQFIHFIPNVRLNVAYIDRMKSDSVRGDLLLHGYLYKMGVSERTFNSRLKRTWWGQIIYRLYFLIFTKSIVRKKDIIELMHLNVTYDKLFKS